MKTLVIAFGGSIITFDKDYFEAFRNFVKKISENFRIFIVAGGGRTARNYIEFGREMGLDETKLDKIGIDATRLNARLLSSILDANDTIPGSVDEAINLDSRIVVMGGTTPGHSTDAVAAELAERSGADMLVIATDVDGIYDKDPKKYTDAKLIERINVEEIIRKYGTGWRRAGDNVIIDGPALDIIRRGKFATIVLNGKDIENMRKAVEGKQFKGTKIERG